MSGFFICMLFAAFVWCLVGWAESHAKVGVLTARLAYADAERVKWVNKAHSLHHQLHHKRAFQMSSMPVIDPLLLKRLLSLCHPDKHGNSAMATEVTRQLLAMRK